MPEASARIGTRANFGGDRTVVTFGPNGQHFAALRNLFRALWPAKTSLEYAARTGACERTAHRVLAGEREPSADALIALLHTEDGYSVLLELMRGHHPKWWRDVQNNRDMGRAARKIDEARRELERLSRTAAD